MVANGLINERTASVGNTRRAYGVLMVVTMLNLQCHQCGCGFFFTQQEKDPPSDFIIISEDALKEHQQSEYNDFAERPCARPLDRNRLCS